MEPKASFERGTKHSASQCRTLWKARKIKGRNRVKARPLFTTKNTCKLGDFLCILA